MRLITLLLTVFGIFGSIKVDCQEWAPIGAKWHYNMNDPVGIFGMPGSAYSVFEVTGDSIIDGINCRKIEKSKS